MHILPHNVDFSSKYRHAKSVANVAAIIFFTTGRLIPITFVYNAWTAVLGCQPGYHDSLGTVQGTDCGRNVTTAAASEGKVHTPPMSIMPQDVEFSSEYQHTKSVANIAVITFFTTGRLIQITFVNDA